MNQYLASDASPLDGESSPPLALRDGPSTGSDRPESAELSAAPPGDERWRQLALLFRRKLLSLEQKLSKVVEEKQLLEGQRALFDQLLEKRQQLIDELRDELSAAQRSCQERAALAEQLASVHQLQQQLRQLQRQERTSQLQLEEAKEALAEQNEAATLQKQRVEKLAAALRDRDRRIQELQQYEMSLCKATEQRQQLEEELEEEKHQKQLLEKQLHETDLRHDELKKQLEQLQRVVHYLRDKAQEAHLEKQQLQAAYQENQELLSALSVEKQQLESEAAEQRSLCLEAVKRRQESQEHLLVAAEQQRQLKNRLIAVQQELVQKEQALVEAHQILEQIKHDRHQLAESYKRQKEEVAHLEQQSADQKEQLVQLLAEYEELSSSQERLLERSEASERRLHILERQLEEEEDRRQVAEQRCEELAGWQPIAEELYQQQQQLIEDRQQLVATMTQQEALFCRKQEELEAQRIAVEGELQQSCKERDALVQEREGLLEEQAAALLLAKRCEALSAQLKEALAALRLLEKREGDYQLLVEERLVLHAEQQSQLARLHAESLVARQSLEEREEALRLAHHHLAKKVKECSDLGEEQTELQIALAEQKEELIVHQKRLQELQGTLSTQLKQLRDEEERRLEERREGELRLREWEKKYFDLWNQFQEQQKRQQQQEEQLRHQEQQLRRYGQLEQLLKRLSASDLAVEPAPTPSVASVPVSEASLPGTEAEQEPPFIPLTLAGRPESKEFPLSPPPAKEASLFAISEGTLKHKEHLFD